MSTTSGREKSIQEWIGSATGLGRPIRELGVRRVVPLAARSEKALIGAAGKRAERWRKILLEASQQSRRVRVPELAAVVKPEEAFAPGLGTSGEGLRILL